MTERNLGCNILALPETELYAEAAKRIVELARTAISERGRFMAAICGGDAPKPLYELLAKPEWKKQIDWSRTHVFWGDERVVPAEDPASNYRMANEALLSHVPIASGNVHRVLTEAGIPGQVAEIYQESIKNIFGVTGHEIPRFDLMLLGMGENGHTASLFPHSPLLLEQHKLVATQFVSEVGQWRVTMTPPLINNSREVLFLVTGARKAGMVRQVLTGSFAPADYPAQIVRPANGSLLWMLDTAAASLLSEKAA